MKSIPTIVLTGGPCAGKTSSLARIKSWLTEIGYAPIMVPEMATLLIEAGYGPTMPGFQRELFRLQHAIEARCESAAEHLQRAGKKPVVILDRALVDTKAYTELSAFADILATMGVQEARLLERYHAVVHLRTAAYGAERFYTLENNAARREGTLAEARIQDDATLHAWLPHPHLTIIDNRSDGFEGKLLRVQRAIAHALGIPEPLEIERKFLVDSTHLHSIPVPCTSIMITQTYLARGRASARVRKAVVHGYPLYTYTEKRDIRPGMRIEIERSISASEYEHCLLDQDSARTSIEKERRVFVWENQRYELDLFIAPKPGLVLLEAEVHDLQEALVLPSFIPILREVTTEETYSNARLALRT